MDYSSICQHYSEGHDRLDELFREFQARESAERLQAIRHFQEFRSGLERHIVWEEELLFPPYERRTDYAGGPTEVMRWEHRQIRAFLEAIADKLARDVALVLRRQIPRNPLNLNVLNRVL